MTQNGAPRGSDRRGGGLLKRAGLVFLAVGLALTGAHARAGDRAQLDIIGYSADSRYFAFEEYGIQDGVGSPYSSIFIVDLETDSWTAGSPFSVVPRDEEEVLLAAVRAEAREKAASQLQAFAITVPADVLALVGDGEVGANGKALDFGTPGYLRPGEIYESYRLDLEIFDVASPEPCQDHLGEEAKGFALILTGDGTEHRELHRDTTLPKSRGCPLDYRLYAVVAPIEKIELGTMVLFISTYPFGFEGPDRRFIALPIGR